MTKAKEQKASVTEQFHKLFDDSPIGIVIIADNYIEKANNAFLKLIGSEKLIFHKQCLHDFFDIKSNGSEVAELKKCFKGLAEKCSIKNVALKNSTQQVDIHVSHFSIFTENKLIVQFVEKESTANINKPCRLCWIDEADTQNHCVAQAAEKGKAGNGQISSLTKREYQITSLSAQGFQIKEIAEELQLSSRTVEKHRSNIMRKTGANSIIEAIAKVAELHHN